MISRMFHCILAVSLGLVIDLPLQAGGITGVVKASGRVNQGEGGGSGNYDSRKFKFVERIDYSAFRDFVISVHPLQGGPRFPLSTNQPTKRVVQKDAQFVPHILAIQSGARVEWPNQDEIFHNVFSLSEAMPFDLGLYLKGEQKTLQFDQAGRVDVFCSIHKSMSAVVLVLDTPYFTQTDKNGRFVLPDLPEGRWRVRAWHERMFPKWVEVVVPASGTVSLDLTVNFEGATPGKAP